MNQYRPTHPWVAEAADRVRFAACSIFAQDSTDIVKAAQPRRAAGVRRLLGA